MTESVSVGETLSVGGTETLAVNSEVNNAGSVANSGTVALTGGLSQAGQAASAAVTTGAQLSARAGTGRRRASTTVSNAILPGVLVETDSLTAQLRPVSVTVSPTNVSLTTDVTPDVLASALAERDATDVVQREAFGGAVRHVAADGRTPARVRLDAETRRALDSFDAFVTGVSASQTTPEFESVSLDLTRTATPTAGTPSENPTADFALSRVNRAGAVGFDPEEVRGADRRGDELELAVRVSPTQAAAIISLFPTVAAAAERQPTDAESFYVDTTDGDLRVQLDAPAAADDGLSGEWVVSDWELSLVGVGSRPWEGSIQLQRPR